MIDKILDEARKFYNDNSVQLYPFDYELSVWWEEKRKRISKDICNFEAPVEVIHAAQRRYSFDHRTSYKEEIVKFKLSELEKMFGEVPNIKDSEYSISSTVVNGYSNIFLWHLNFYMRCVKYCKSPKKILEIGSGYGGLARIFKLLHPNIEYTLLDLNESLFFAYVFLSMNFGVLDFNFIPLQLTETLYGKEYDIVINTGSFQEMTDRTVESYFDFIQNKIKVRYLYSCNYIKKLNSNESISSNPLQIDDKWKILYRKENPTIVTIDSDREWLEIFLERSN